MSFWSESPGPKFWHSIRAAVGKAAPPTRITGTIQPHLDIYKCIRATVADADEIIQFWDTNFNNAEKARTTYLRFDLEEMLAAGTANRTIILIVRSRHGSIIGTIMARPLGHWTRTCVQATAAQTEPFETSYIDMLCVKRKYEKHGLGRALLYGIRDALNKEGRVASLFLKEGAPLSRFIPPVRTSYYTYRRVGAAEPHSFPGVTLWSRDQFSAWIKDLHKDGKRTNYIVNSGAATIRSIIIAYKGHEGTCVAVFSPSHQIHPADNKTICWMTGYIDDGKVSEAEKADALVKASAVAAYQFASPWTWMDGKHCPPDHIWAYDGPYHFYCFGWDPKVYFNGDTVILM